MKELQTVLKYIEKKMKKCQNIKTRANDSGIQTVQSQRYRALKEVYLCVDRLDFNDKRPFRAKDIAVARKYIEESWGDKFSRRKGVFTFTFPSGKKVMFTDKEFIEMTNDRFERLENNCELKDRTIGELFPKE